MSKMVLMIFLFSLVLIMTMFLRIYGEKVISDTARSRVAYMSEIATGAASFSSAVDSAYLERNIQIEQASRDYTIVVQSTEEGAGTRKTFKTVFMFAWKDLETIDAINDAGGFAAAAATTLPSGIKMIKFFKGKQRIVDDPTSAMGFEEMKGKDADTLVIRPSARASYWDEYVLFYRNGTKFCIGTVTIGNNLKQSIEKFGKRCCGEYQTSTGGTKTPDVC
jgi:hypothetical protein